MTVYVVVTGENGERGRVVSIHRNYEDAKYAALTVAFHFDGGWEYVENDTWENGCNFVYVKDYEVT